MKTIFAVLRLVRFMSSSLTRDPCRNLIKPNAHHCFRYFFCTSGRRPWDATRRTWGRSSPRLGWQSSSTKGPNTLTFWASSAPPVTMTWFFLDL